MTEPIMGTWKEHMLLIGDMGEAKICVIAMQPGRGLTESQVCKMLEWDIMYIVDVAPFKPFIYCSTLHA